MGLAVTQSALIAVSGNEVVIGAGPPLRLRAGAHARAGDPQRAGGLAGLQQLSNIAVPGWSLANPPSFDIQAFDGRAASSTWPLGTRGATSLGTRGRASSAIDTTTNTIVGTLSVPDCNAVNVQRNSFQCPSGVSVLNDQRKVVVTSRGEAGQNWVEIFDIGASPTAGAMLNKIILPNNQLEPDELDYDPANRRVYVANTNGSFFQAVIDGVTNQLLGQIPVAPSAASPRWSSHASAPPMGSSTRPVRLTRSDPHRSERGGVWRGGRLVDHAVSGERHRHQSRDQSGLDRV